MTILLYAAMQVVSAFGPQCHAEVDSISVRAEAIVVRPEGALTLRVVFENHDMLPWIIERPVADHNLGLALLNRRGEDARDRYRNVDPELGEESMVEIRGGETYVVEVSLADYRIRSGDQYNVRVHYGASFIQQYLEFAAKASRNRFGAEAVERLFCGRLESDEVVLSY